MVANGKLLHTLLQPAGINRSYTYQVGVSQEEHTYSTQSCPLPFVMIHDQYDTVSTLKLQRPNLCWNAQRMIENENVKNSLSTLT